MPNIQAVVSAPFILDADHQKSAADSSSNHDTSQPTVLVEKTRSDPSLDESPAYQHSVEISFQKEEIKSNSSSINQVSTSSVIRANDVAIVIPRAGSSKNELMGTPPITKRQVTTLTPITPLMEASLETSHTSNITSSVSIEHHRFQSLVDSNNVSYGSVDVSYDGSGPYICYSPYVE
jgi:hypothetical protein